MTSVRFLAMLSTVLLVVGALLVGKALHGGVVQGTYALTSPYVVIRVILGSIFIALGYRFKTPAEEYVSTPSDRPTRSEQEADPSPDADQTGEFDHEMSPLGGDGLEHVEGDRDESRGGEGRGGENRDDESRDDGSRRGDDARGGEATGDDATGTDARE